VASGSAFKASSKYPAKSNSVNDVIASVAERIEDNVMEVFVWKANPDAIVATLNWGLYPLGSNHYLEKHNYSYLFQIQLIAAVAAAPNAPMTTRKSSSLSIEKLTVLLVITFTSEYANAAAAMNNITKTDWIDFR